MENKETRQERDYLKEWGWSIFSRLSKIDTQLISTIILVLVSIQVLFGLFQPASDTYLLVALYFGKTAIIRFLGYLGILLGIIDFYCKCYVYRGKAAKWTFLMRPWISLLGILMVWAFLAIAIAKDRNLAVFGSAFRFEGYLSYLAYAGLFVCASQIKTEKSRNIIFKSVAISSTVLAIFTLIKELFKAKKILIRGGQVIAYSGTFINSNHYAYYLCVSMMIIACLFLMSDKTWKKVCYGICFAIQMVVMLYNASLGPYIALFIGLVAYFVFCWIRKGFKAVWPLLLIFAVFIGLSFVINNHRMISDLKLIVEQSAHVISTIESGGSHTSEGQQAIDSIGSSRGALWKKTIQVIKENPIMGVGTDNVQLYIGNEIPHNEYLQIGANLGLVGLVLYLGALISCFVYTLKHIKKISDGALIAGMAVIVYCCSAFVGISIPVAAYQLFVFFGMLNGWFKNAFEEKMNEDMKAKMDATISTENIAK